MNLKNKKNIIITGASGQVGTELVKGLKSEFNIIPIVRSAPKDDLGLKYFYCKNLADKDCLIVITSGPDTHEIDYVREIIEKSELTDDNKVLNLAGKITLLELAALIQGCKCFIGLDSVASHIAASVNTDSVTLFGPSNLVNWKPWSNKARVIQKENLEDIKVEEVINLLDDMYIN